SLPAVLHIGLTLSNLFCYCLDQGQPFRRRMANQRPPAKSSRIAKKKSPPPAKKVTPPVARARRPDPPARVPASRPAAAAAVAPPPAEVKKPGFYQAVAVYERGVQALQRHDFQGAAVHFRTVVENFPEERELLERARLYLRVCERETERR